MPSAKLRGTIFAAFAALLVQGGSTARAETVVVFNKLVKEVKIGGDLRLRQENFDNSGTSVDRQRQRLRLRVGAAFKLPNNVAVKTRFATTEGGDQVSTNQTLTGNASKKPVEIDMAYVEWKPGDATFMAGKSANPFWTPASADVMWDSDYTPEGLSESWQGLLGPLGVFANAGQYAIAERSSSLEDAYLFSEQLGVEFRLPLQARLKTAVAHHEFTNIRQGAIGGTSSLATNTAGAGFSILEWTSALNFWIRSVPVSLQGTVLRNNAAPKTTVGGALSTPEEQDEAVHVGVVLGKASAGKFEFGGFYKEVERDAAVSGITDSDFPNNTNAQGWIGWIAYGINDFMTAQIKHFDAEKKVHAATGINPESATTRTQFDVSVTF